MTASVHTFDTARGWHAFLWDAYVGGFAWENPTSTTLGTAQLYGHTVREVSDGEVSRQVVVEEATGTVRSYLVPWPGETVANFNRRRSLAVYVNLVEPIVDAYVDAVTASVSRDLGTLAPDLTNLDRQGQTWKEFVSDAARAAAVDGVVACVIDAPETNPATNLAEQRALRVGLRASVVSVTAWAWMSLTPDGDVEEFAYVDAAQADTTQATQTIRTWVWRADTRTEKGDVVPGGWAVYESSVYVTTGLGAQRQGVLAGRCVRQGPLHPALGGRIPVVFAYHRRLRTTSRAPEGKSLAASPAAIARQVYQLLSNVEDTQRRTPPFLAVPTASKGGLEPETQAKVGPDSALPVPEGSGMPQWITFPTQTLQDLRAHVVFLVALAYRVSGLEVQADQSAQVQSGEALRVRSRDFEARAKKLAVDVEAFERRALAVACAYLGADPDALRVTYPSRFVLGDTAELLASALSVLDKLGGQLGTQGTLAVMRQALNAALTLDDAQLANVMAEVEARMDDAAKAALASATAATTGDGTKAADAALNGAQVASLVDVVVKVAAGELPRDAAQSIIERAFLVTPADATQILGSAGTSFKVEAAEPHLSPAPAQETAA